MIKAELKNFIVALKTENQKKMEVQYTQPVQSVTNAFLTGVISTCETILTFLESSEETK